MGGITIAQKLETASQPDMPETAIDTGCIEFVLSPEDIAHEIVKIAHGRKDGFNAGQSEIGLRARTDLFDAVLMIGFDDRDVEVEEAYLVTRALPAGLRLKAGKFLSDIGYMNSRHPHDWSFIERPLVNQYLFGDHGLQERGVQLGYTAATADYLAFGIELLQGNGEGQNRFDDGAYKRERSGPRMMTAFAKYGPDLGDRHAAQLGVSTGMSRQYARVDGHDDHRHSVEGDGWFAGIDAMYRYDSGRAYGVGNWRVGGEYYYTQRSVRARGYNDARGWRENPAPFHRKAGRTLCGTRPWIQKVGSRLRSMLRPIPGCGRGSLGIFSRPSIYISDTPVSIPSWAGMYTRPQCARRSACCVQLCPGRGPGYDARRHSRAAFRSGLFRGDGDDYRGSRCPARPRLDENQTHSVSCCRGSSRLSIARDTNVQCLGGQ